MTDPIARLAEAVAIASDENVSPLKSYGSEKLVQLAFDEGASEIAAVLLHSAALVEGPEYEHIALRHLEALRKAHEALGAKLAMVLPAAEEKT